MSAWSSVERKAVKGLQAGFSTRLGAALRHMGTLCSKRLQQPMVLVLTDGIPSDVDVENDNYLLGCSIRSGSTKDEGVAVNCLKIGSMQGQVCQQIFGIPHTVVCEADNIELAIRSVLKKIRKSFS